jgi:hypothetical protein
MPLLSDQIAFYRDHGLTAWADALAGLSWTEQGPDADGFAPFAIFPPVTVQRAGTTQLVEAMSAPTDALPPAEHYGGHWIQSFESLAGCEITGRPDGTYALWLRDGGFPPETMGLTCSKLLKVFAASNTTGLTVHEFFILQRMKTLQDGDHRWSSYYGSDDHPPGIQWLPNARTGKKVFQGYWVAKSGQVQIGACKTGSKKPSRGAHPCLVTSLEQPL